MKLKQYGRESFNFKGSLQMNLSEFYHEIQEKEEEIKKALYNMVLSTMVYELEHVAVPLCISYDAFKMFGSGFGTSQKFTSNVMEALIETVERTVSFSGFELVGLDIVERNGCISFNIHGKTEIVEDLAQVLGVKSLTDVGYKNWLEDERTVHISFGGYRETQRIAKSISVAEVLDAMPNPEDSVNEFFTHYHTQKFSKNPDEVLCEYKKYLASIK